MRYTKVDIKGVRTFMESIQNLLHQIQRMQWSDYLDIAVVAFLIYKILPLIKTPSTTRIAKAVVAVLVIAWLTDFLHLYTVGFIMNQFLAIGLLALVILFQPELRKALEQLGQKNLIRSVIPFESSKPEEGLFSDRTIREIVKGCVEMSRAKTGALIVVRQLDSLAEYERTGIAVDGIVTSQLLINIFEKNTPLHDGAVIVQGNRVTYATCYLPLSDNMRLSKDLGTRHRAGVGISEVTDSMTVIVSEENGKISVAYEGTLSRGLTAEELEEKLRSIQKKPTDEKAHKRWKGWFHNEK